MLIYQILASWVSTSQILMPWVGGRPDPPTQSISIWRPGNFDTWWVGNGSQKSSILHTGTLTFFCLFVFFIFTVPAETHWAGSQNFGFWYHQNEIKMDWTHHWTPGADVQILPAGVCITTCTIYRNLVFNVMFEYANKNISNQKYTHLQNIKLNFG